MSNNEHFHNCKYNDQAKKDEMGGACSTHVGEEECIQNFGDKSKKKNEITRKT
jgi:hypothetical protein